MKIIPNNSSTNDIYALLIKEFGLSERDFIDRSPMDPVPEVEEEIILGDEQLATFERIEKTRDHYFITGKAGTGKSILLQYLKKNSARRLVVVAPTGVSAINVGGQTIHSMFGIPPSFIAPGSLKLNTQNVRLLQNLDVLVVDEISMVRADLMDAMDHLLRQAKDCEEPFGGAQVVMFGDLYQLPPVVNDAELHKYFADNNGGYFFFHADVWRQTPLQTVELSKVYRQKDADFIYLLDEVRRGSRDHSVLTQFNDRAGILPPDTGVITLASTNASANEINEYRLSQLSDKGAVYEAEVTGSFEKSAFPTEEFLKLKPGAQVMMLKNDREKRWFNGTIGVVHSLSEDQIKVEIDGIVYPVSRETWQKVKYTYNQSEKKIKEEVASAFTQFPLRLAWAITIHKSQGQTFEQVCIDMGYGAFAHGQTYVALSRCTALGGVYLKRELRATDIIVEQHVVEFMNRA